MYTFFGFSFTPRNHVLNQTDQKPTVLVNNTFSNQIGSFWDSFFSSKISCVHFGLIFGRFENFELTKLKFDFI